MIAARASASRALAAGLTAAAVGAGGCAGLERGPDPQEYREEVTRIMNGFGAAGRQLRASVGPKTTLDQNANALERFQRGTLRAGAALEGLRPPAEVADANRDLAQALRAIARAAQPSIDAGRAGDRRAFNAALTRLLKGLNGSLGRRAREAAARIDSGLPSG